LEKIFEHFGEMCRIIDARLYAAVSLPEYRAHFLLNSAGFIESRHLRKILTHHKEAGRDLAVIWPHGIRV